MTRTASSHRAASARRLLLSLTIAGLVAAPAAAALVPPEAATAVRVVVGFHEPPGAQRGELVFGGPVVDLDEALRFVVVATSDPERIRIEALLDPNVRYVERDAAVRTTLVPNDARYGDSGHYGSKKIGAETAWHRTLGSTSVKVAVIDTGLLKTHEEFAGSGRVLQGRDVIMEDNDPEDICGHGTHVTGTIAATINNGKGIAGLAQVSVIPIRALTGSGLVTCSGLSSDLAQALRYAADQGAHFTSNSWGGGGGSAINDAIGYGYNKGVIHVGAAGNDGPCSNCVSEPWRSNAAKVIVVASTDSRDRQSGFSSEGPQVDVAAPGSGILSAYSTGTSSYATLSGTSMATPHVTGAAALLKSLNPSWGFAEIDQRLKDTAVDLGAAGKDDDFGYGRIDVGVATGSGTGANQFPTACFSHAETSLSTSVDASCSSDPDGTLASYAWDWGDGTTGTGKTASHAYPVSGTYVVTLTVTDDDGASATASQSVSVTGGTDPDPSVPNLSNGVALHATSGAQGTSQTYKIEVPPGQSQLMVMLDREECPVTLTCLDDLDLSVNEGTPPPSGAWTCESSRFGSAEACLSTPPAAGWWYVRVSVATGSDVPYVLTATYE